MKTAEVVYVPVPSNPRERNKDPYVKKTTHLLAEEGFTLQGTEILIDSEKEQILVQIWKRDTPAPP